MITPDSNEPRYCGNCGATLLSNKTCPNKCSVVTYVMGSSPSHRAAPIPPTEPSLPPYTPQPSPQSKSNKIYLIVIAALVLMLIGAGFFELGQITKGNLRGTTGNTQSNSNPSGTLSANGNTPATSIVPTATPTFTPTPTPTPCPTPCILYSEDGSHGWNGWALSSDWRKVAGGLLISEGNGDGFTPSAIPPYTIPVGVVNIAIEVSMRTPSTPSLWWDFGINVCGSTQGSWTGYVARISKDYSPSYAILTAETNDNSHTDVSTVNFDPGTDWHTYRLEVRGNKLTFLIDGASVASGTDEQFVSCGNQVGFYDGGGVRREVQVRSFKVIGL